MCRTLIGGNFTKTHTLKIYRDSAWEEYVAQVRHKPTNNLVASYHTPDRDDARSTGEAELRNSTNNCITAEVED